MSRHPFKRIRNVFPFIDCVDIEADEDNRCCIVKKQIIQKNNCKIVENGANAQESESKETDESVESSSTVPTLSVRNGLDHVLKTKSGKSRSLNNSCSKKRRSTSGCGSVWAPPTRADNHRCTLCDARSGMSRFSAKFA